MVISQLMDEVDIHQRHKLEKKALNAQVQSLKHSISKGDKKKKRQVTNEIALLTAELEERHAKELAALGGEGGVEINDNKLESLCIKEACENNILAQPVAQPKISKAQKRREKKEAEERARQKCIEEDNQGSVTHSRNIEAALFEKILKENSLNIFDVDPDGNCMYNAVAVNLHGHTSEETLQKLRVNTSKYMLEHMDDFLPFTSNNTTGDMLSVEEYKEYCNDIKETNSWGGELELRAISQINHIPIEVYQAHGPKLLIGEEFKGDPIRLSYHRHQYGLGEHYNALIDADT